MSSFPGDLDLSWSPQEVFIPEDSCVHMGVGVCMCVCVHILTASWEGVAVGGWVPTITDYLPPWGPCVGKSPPLLIAPCEALGQAPCGFTDVTGAGFPSFRWWWGEGKNSLVLGPRLS